MAQEIIGQHDGQDFFVGQNDPTSTGAPSSNLPGTPGANQTGMTPTNTVVTADPATNAVNNLGGSIGSAAVTPPVTPTPTNPSGTYNPSYDANTDPSVAASINDTNQYLADRRTQLQKERDSEVKALQDQENVDKTQLNETQAGETGSSARNLLYLQGGGQSASAQAYLNTLEVSHTREMANLTAKYNTAIQAAQSAYDDKDFTAADEMVKNAKAIKDDAYKRNQDFLDNTIKIHDEIVKDQTVAYNQTKLQQDQIDGARTYATSNGITQPFYELGGTVFNTRTGQMYDPTDPDAVKNYLADGGSADMSNVFSVVGGKTKDYSGPIGEYQYVVDSGQFKGTYPEWLNKKKQDAVDIAAAGKPDPTISTEQQKLNQQQDENAAIAATIQGWKDGNFIQGNKKISSTDYIKAKQGFISRFGPAAAADFDSAMVTFIDMSGKDYAKDYGLNP